MFAGFLLGALAAADVHTACVSVARAGLANAQVLAKDCAAQRPASGFWLPQGAEDCEQFRAMLHLAQRLQGSALTPESFCADVQDPDAGLLAAHSQCMHLWSTGVADAAGVRKALQEACEAGHGPSCTQFATALDALPQDQRRSLCDHTVTNGTGTWALDTQHLQYSCREFALNCAQDRTCTPEAAARCSRAGFSEGFCTPFARLVSALHAGEEAEGQAETWCKAHAKAAASPTEVPAPAAAPATAAPAAPTVAPAPVAAAVAAVATTPAATPTSGPSAPLDPEAAVTDCVEHTKQMLALGLGSEELQHVAGEVCAKKYAAGICGNFTALVSRAASTAEEPAKATALHDACRVAISQNPFDMFSVCKQAVDKVEGTELEGDAFQKASFEVCTRLLEHEMQSVDAPITDGCTYFSGQLATARAKGPVQADTFCTQLTSTQEGTEDAQKAEEAPATKASSLVEEKPKVISAKSAPLLKAKPAAAEEAKPAAVKEAKPAAVKEAKHPATTEAKAAATEAAKPAATEAAKPATTEAAKPAAAEEVKSAPVAHKSAPAAAAKPKVPKASLMEGSSRKVLLRKHTDAPSDLKASAEDEAFLNKFLDDYETKAGAPQTLDQRVDKAFPEAQPTPAAKSSDSDDVISDFLSNYDH